MKRTPAQLLLDAAVIWHAATVLSGQRESRADQHLHRACARYLRDPQSRKAPKRAQKKRRART